MEGVLFIMLVGLFFYILSIDGKFKSLLDRVNELDDHVRRLHVKVVNQLGELGGVSPEAKPVTQVVQPAAPPTQPQASSPVISRPPVPAQPTAAPRPVIRTDFPMSKPPSWEAPSIDWEKFMGVKLFAWLGGFALFLGMAFFVKYSIDHNLISPMARIILGFLTGIGVIVGGLVLRRKGYAVTVQTLCAAGISILYADIFAARTAYQFLSPEAAFLMMTLVTAASFVLAVRLDSKYVAILGLIGGFLTPPLLSTGEDHPIGLFSYIAMLDIGLAAVALRKRWSFLLGMSAAATFIMEIGWTEKFFTPDKAPLAVGIYLVFCVLYAAISRISRSQKEEDEWFYLPAGVLPLVSMGFVAYMLTLHSLGLRPGLVLSFLLVLGGLQAALAVRRDSLRLLYLLGGLVSFALLSFWTTTYLKEGLLFWGLASYLAFAIVHTIVPMVMQRLNPSTEPFLWGYIAPLLMMVLILVAMVVGEVLSFVLWPFLFVLGMMGIALAWLAGSILAAGATLILIMAAFGIWLFRLPDAAGLPGILTLLAFFACSFFAWGLVVIRKSSLLPGNARLSAAKGIRPEYAAQIPAFSALMPFMLLGMFCLKLTLPNPSDVFGLMLLMGILCLALVRHRTMELAGFLALLGTVVVEYFWHVQSFKVENAGIALVWYLVFYVLFTAFPFLFRKKLNGTLPWIAAALSGPLQFYLIYRVVTEAIGKAYIGFLPLLFALPSLMGLYEIVRTTAKTDERRETLIALFGAVSLFFITLIIPLQFDREWITLGWALEGLALIWLYGRILHDGLKVWGVALLMTSFVRLALNPAVLSYHPRTTMPLMNWYLWVYGAAALSQLLSARLLPPPRNRLLEQDLPPVLNSLGTILLFLLLNIEIADYYSTGATITFQFSGNIAQDMTYSLAWAVFAIGLLVVGIRKGSQGARYASVGLLLVTIVKVFLHDLWRLGQLYRVASFVGLAVVLILVSFLYQRYLPKSKTEEVRRG